jgi:uncharacterized protein (TIGR03435 family)
VPPFDTVNDRGQPVIKGSSALNLLALSLRRLADGLIVDKTGLSGSFDYEFVVPVPGLQRGGRGTAGPDASDISAALQDQLGLQLLSEKVPLDLIVIDRIDRPSPN